MSPAWVTWDDMTWIFFFAWFKKDAASTSDPYHTYIYIYTHYIYIYIDIFLCYIHIAAYSCKYIIYSTLCKHL